MTCELYLNKDVTKEISQQKEKVLLHVQSLTGKVERLGHSEAQGAKKRSHVVWESEE